MAILCPRATRGGLLQSQRQAWDHFGQYSSRRNHRLLLSQSCSKVNVEIRYIQQRDVTL